MDSGKDDDGGDKGMRWLLIKELVRKSVSKKKGEWIDDGGDVVLVVLPVIDVLVVLLVVAVLVEPHDLFVCPFADVTLEFCCFFVVVIVFHFLVLFLLIFLS